MPSNVNIIDPNTINNSIFPETGIPDSSKMFIFVEFTASRRNRTILNQINQGQIIAQDIYGNAKNSVTISMMGFDQNPNSSTFGMYTTKYVDNGGTETQWEGFGITNIKIVVNASYVPQVNIDFIDNRGVAFYNRDDSPYRILYDIPPPIFSLTIKGYYGRSLTYQLHLVKYYTKFDAKTGNYSINAEFVGLTFAPLADVLFQYIIQFPQMQQGINTSVSPSQTTAPEHTYELLTKTKNAYDNLANKVKATAQNQAFETAKTSLETCTDFFNIVETFGNNASIFGSNATNFASNFVILNESTFDTNNQPLSYPIYTQINLSDYNNYIKSQGTSFSSTNSNQRLILAYKFYTNNTSVANGFPKLVTLLQNKANSIISNAPSIPIPSSFLSIPPSTDLNQTNITYYGIDITNTYVSIYNQLSILQNAANTAQNALVNAINNIIAGKLGMTPTIYNIFNILCTDIDFFFQKIRDTAISAENSHKQYKDKILSSSGYRDTGNNGNPTIFAFPDYIQTSTVNGGTVDNKISPRSLTTGNNPIPFPEIDLVNAFIGSYLKLKEHTAVSNMKSQTDSNGNNKWIPISPLDSTIANIFGTPESPYIGIDSSTGSGTNQNPASITHNIVIDQIFSIILYRYYVLTQFTYNSYNPNDNSVISDFFSSDKGTNLINFYAEAEATNLANSLSNSNLINNVQSVTTSFSNNGQAFLNYCKQNLSNQFTFGYTGTPNWFSIDTDNNMFNTTGNTSAILNKLNPAFRGASIPLQAPSLRQTNSPATSFNPPVSGGDGSNNMIEIFINKKNPNIFSKFFSYFTGNYAPNLNFTQDNCLFVKDSIADSTLLNGINPLYVSRYLFGQYVIAPNNNRIKSYVNKNTNYYTIINNAALLDKNSVNLTTIDYNPTLENIINIWNNALSINYADFYKRLTGTTNDYNEFEIRNLIILSNFGATLSVFSDTGGLNSNFFNLPAYFEVPEYFLAYMGLICTITNSYKTDPNQILYNNIVNFYANNANYNYGITIFADINDCINYMSINDSLVFINEYNNFYNVNNTATNFNDNTGKLLSIINGLKSILSPTTFYQNMLTTINNNSSVDPNVTIFMPLTNKNYLSVYTEITFRKSIMTGQSIFYESLSKQISGAYTNQKTGALNYFGTLFSKLNGPDLLPKLKQDKLNTENQFNNDINDDDIYTQTYYSFKNAYDKWIAGFGQYAKGAPFNGTKNLIDRFVFVDRAMNPIGDTIIDPKDLLEMADIDKNSDINVFSVMSRLLSKNGFEFFPLQNFMTYAIRNGKPGTDPWDNAFSLQSSIVESSNDSNFVCMYIGGFSQRPSNLSSASDYISDGLINFKTDNPSDFSTAKPNNLNVTNNGGSVDNNAIQEINNPNFPFRNVRAFEVNFGTQNQSMFYDIDIDSREFPETNESLTLLSQIADNNGKSSPTAKSQNLYNVYEARSYKATIHGLGNVMIQPTEYFQLNNVPMFEGVYLIIGVEHDVNSNNYMTTHFTGIKIAKNPKPLVKTPFIISGINVGSSVATNQALNNTTTITPAFNANNLSTADLDSGLHTLLV